MKKLLMLMAMATVVFGTVAMSYAQPASDLLDNLARFLGRDESYYHNRWDPEAERFLRFEDRVRDRVEQAYHNGNITRREVDRLRNEIAYFDNSLRNALADGHLDRWETRNLERQQDELRANVRREIQEHRDYSYGYGYGYDRRDYR